MTDLLAPEINARFPVDAVSQPGNEVAYKTHTFIQSLDLREMEPLAFLTEALPSATERGPRWSRRGSILGGIGKVVSGIPGSYYVVPYLVSA